MPRNFTPRETAERIELFGEDLRKLINDFDRDARRMGPLDERINSIPNQEHLDEIAAAFEALGALMCRECDQAEEAEDRRRDSPLEPDHRRLGQ